MAEEVKLSLAVEGRREVERELSRVDRAVDEVGRGLRDLDGDAGHAERSLRDLSRDGDRSMRSLSSDVDRATSAVGRDLRGVGADTDRASRDLRELAHDADRAANDMQGSFDGLSLPDFGEGIGLAGGAGAGVLGLAAAFGGEALMRGTGAADFSEDIFFGLGNAAASQAAAARLGVDPDATRDLIETVGIEFATLAAEDIAEAFVAVGENLPTEFGQLLQRRVGQIAQLEQAGFGDSQEIALAVANTAAAFTVDADRALDIVTTALQSGANRQGDFFDTLTEYANNVGDLGLSIEDFTTQLIEGSDPSRGLYNLDKVGDSLRELANRVRTGGDEVTDGLAALGLARDDVAEAFASGQGREPFQEIVSRLQEIGGTAEGQQIATDLFGAPYEDLGTELFEVLDLTESRLVDVNNAAQAVADTLSGSVYNRNAGGFIRGMASQLFNPDRSSTPGNILGAEERRGPSAMTSIYGPAIPNFARGNGFVGPIAERLENNVNVQVDVNVRGGVIDNTGTQRALAAALGPHITREVDRQVRRSSVFGGRTEGTR